MQSAIWPSTIPELFRQAAGRLVAEEDPETIVDRLREGLGVEQVMNLADPELICARDAAMRNAADFDKLVLTLIMAIGRQLKHQYPTSSLVWDSAMDELVGVMGAYGYERLPGGRWNRQTRSLLAEARSMDGLGDPSENGRRTVVVELRETYSNCPDERRFTLGWGLVLEGVPFCRHGDGHHLTCCAVAGGMGSVRPPHGETSWVISSGVLIERGPGDALRVIGREGFRARLHRLATFCDRISTDRGRLVELVSDSPWRAGIGIAERLRNADSATLQRLIG